MIFDIARYSGHNHDVGTEHIPSGDMHRTTLRGAGQQRNMRHTVFLVLAIISHKLDIPDFSKEFSIGSLRKIESKCPSFEKFLVNAELKLDCDGNYRTLTIARVLNFDGASYIKDPESHGVRVLGELSKTVGESLKIEKRYILCEDTMDRTGRCMSLFFLQNSRNFTDAVLKIAPQNDKIDDFYYFFIITWEAEE